MKYLIVFCLLLFTGLGKAQTEIRKSSLSTGGGSAEVGNIKIVQAIGEVAIREAGVGNTHLSEGFVGPDMAQLIMGVEDYEPLTGFQIFPSPVKDYLHVQFDATGDYQIHLFDLTGKLIYENSHENTRTLQVDMRRFPAGIYLVLLVDKSNEKAVSVKIQKQ